MLTLVVGVASAQDEVVLVVGWEQEPDVLTPLSTSAFSAYLRDFYGRRVWDWDTNYNIYPIMVDEVPTVENGMVTTNDAGNTVVTYQLRQDMKWSDGEPITADDCLFGHTLMVDPATGTILERSDYPNVVESVEKVDDYTLVQTFNTPYPDYYNDTVFLRCHLPEHVLQPLMDGNGGTLDGLPYFTRAEGVVGYGPYILESWIPGDSITFVPNPNWDGQQPAINRVILKFITETAQMQNALEAGEIDLAFNFTDDVLEGYRAIDGVEVWSVPSVFQDALWFNVREGGDQHPAIQDVNVRRAIVAAIDRETITPQIAGSPDARVPTAYDDVKWRPDDLELISYDPDLANQLLDEAGWVDSNDSGTRDKDGVELILRFFTTPRQSRVDYQLAIQAALQEVGIGTQLFQVPGPAVLFASFTNRGIMATGDYDLSIYALSNDPITPNYDPDSYTCARVPTAEVPDGGNYSAFCNERFDELVGLIRSNTDPESRMEQKHEAVRILTESVFWAGILPRLTHWAVAADRFDPDTMRDVGTLSSNYFQRVEFWQPAQ
jgi:peptide/nickel transport system substrate-binding protein